MGNLAIDSWRRMDSLVLDHGDEGVLHMICDQVAEGLSLKGICEAEGVNYSVLWKWLNDVAHPERMAEYELSLRAKADSEAHAMLGIADSATPEEVGVAKLRVDTRDKLIKKWDRNRYGDKVEVTHNVVPVLNIVTAPLLEEKVVEGVPIEIEDVVDASPSVI